MKGRRTVATISPVALVHWSATGMNIALSAVTLFHYGEQEFQRCFTRNWQELERLALGYS